MRSLELELESWLGGRAGDERVVGGKGRRGGEKIWEVRATFMNGFSLSRLF